MSLGVNDDGDAATKCAEALKMLPEVEQLSLDAEDEDLGPGEGRCLSIESRASDVVKNKWNYIGKTGVVDSAGGELCLCSFEAQGNVAKKDFRACTMGDCTALSHRDVAQGGPSDRIRVPKPSFKYTGSVLAIVVPTAANTKQTGVFASPLFIATDLPDLPVKEGVAIQVDNRILVLLSLNLRPRVLKFLFEGFPGKIALSQPIRKGQEGPTVGSPVAGRQSTSPLFSTPRYIESVSAGVSGADKSKAPGTVLEEVVTSPGLAGVVLGSSHPKLDADSVGVVYPWSIAHDVDDNASAASTGISSIAGDPTVAALTEKLNRQVKEFNTFKVQTTAKDNHLGKTIIGLRDLAHAAVVAAEAASSEIDMIRDE